MNIRKFFMVLFVLSLMLGLAARPAQASTAQSYTCTQYHTVQPGEYLSKIAKMYGVSWRWLAEVNNLSNPNKLYPGQKLCVEIDESQELTCTEYYTVKRGDTLSKIARAYGVSWTWLAEVNNLSNPNKLYAGQVLCVEVDGDDSPPDQPGGVDPALTVLAVSRNESVTVGMEDFPPYDRYNVFMYEYGDDPDHGILIDKVDTGNGGYQKIVFDIPWELQGLARLTLRMESPTTHNAAIVSFYNQNQGGGSSGGNKVYPTISIIAVDKDFSVTIRANNLPADDAFEVLMNKMGTQGKNGILVGTIASGSGGSVEQTFRIPSQLQGLNKIAIRIQSPKSGFFAYNWFYNQ
jgi:LysM repeat protein